MEREKISWKDARLVNQVRGRYTQRTIYPGAGDKKSGKQALPCKGKSYMHVHSVFKL